MRPSRTLTTTISPARPGQRPPPLSLHRFLQRQRTLALWREVVRATSRIPDPAVRGEMRAYARGEFERNRAVGDVVQIRYLISKGREELENVMRGVGGLVGG